jgi:hypothetical protein
MSAIIVAADSIGHVNPPVIDANVGGVGTKRWNQIGRQRRYLAMPDAGPSKDATGGDTRQSGVRHGSARLDSLARVFGNIHLT